MTNSKIKLNLDSLKSRKEWKRHKVVDGHNVFRVLPPFGEASNGYPYRKWQIIWGLVDPESGRARPFASSMTSEKRCPVTEFVTELKKRSETIKSQLQATGTSEEDIKLRLKDLNDLISNLSPKTTYVYNAVNKTGEVGLLELKSTAHKKMKTLMNEYINVYNQDPTSLNSADDDSGVWFDITRQGLGRDTEYDVAKCQIKTKSLTGKVTFEDDRSPLPDSVVENYDNLAYDLSSVYQLKTYEQLQDILNANLQGIVELVPDADLNAPISLSGAPAKAAKPATTNAAPRQAQAQTQNKPLTTKVTTRLDDEDDADADQAPARPSATSKTTVNTGSAVGLRSSSPAVIDDDFMAEADAILNG